MHIDQKQSKTGDLDLIVGTKQVLRALSADALQSVWLAQDADRFIKNKVMLACQTANIPLESDYSMAELGKMGSISIGAACVGIKKRSD